MPKTKYESHVLPNLEKIEGWAKAGATSKDIAEKLKISYSTFRSYIAMGEDGDGRYAALSEAFARACKVPDDEIETALFDRAKGIKFEEKTFERVLNKETGEYAEVLTKRVTKFIPPDPTSAMFWLTNRRPDRWSYKPEAGKDDEDEGTGVVQLAPVMENPGPPVPDGGDADA
jgi:hypothetical protein